MKIDYCNMSVLDKNLLVNDISSIRKGILVFDGSTGSGKTLLLDAVLSKNDKAKKFSAEEFTEKLLYEIQITEDLNISTKNVINSLEFFEIVGVEDIDIQSGKQITLQTIAKTANALAEDTLFIFTGIDIEKRIPELVANLSSHRFMYFYKERRR